MEHPDLNTGQTPTTTPKRMSEQPTAVADDDAGLTGDLAFARTTLANAASSAQRKTPIRVAPFRVPDQPSCRIELPDTPNPAPTATTTAQQQPRPRQIDLTTISAILANTCRILTVEDQDDGYVGSERPTMSAGNRHPIDILIDAPDVDELRSRAWWYDPLRHSLFSANIDHRQLVSAREAVQRSAVRGTHAHATLYLVATFERTLARFAGGTMHVWRDAGALQFALQLAATHQGLTATASHTTDLLDLADNSADLCSVTLNTTNTGARTTLRSHSRSDDHPRIA